MGYPRVDKKIDLYVNKIRKCNLCYQGKCDPDLDFHIGTHFIE
jgi:hypothetical protein